MPDHTPANPRTESWTGAEVTDSPNPATRPPERYAGLTEDELRERLSIAEDVCLMFGWSAYHDDTDRDVATYRLWTRWLDTVGADFVKPKRHPHLNAKAAKELAEAASYTRWLHTFLEPEPARR